MHTTGTLSACLPAVPGQWNLKVNDARLAVFTIDGR